MSRRGQKIFKKKSKILQNVFLGSCTYLKRSAQLKKNENEKTLHPIGQQWTTFEGYHIQTIKMFFINKQTPRYGLSFDIQPILFTLLGFVLLAFKSVK